MTIIIATEDEASIIKSMISDVVINVVVPALFDHAAGLNTLDVARPTAACREGSVSVSYFYLYSNLSPSKITMNGGLCGLVYLLWLVVIRNFYVSVRVCKLCKLLYNCIFSLNRPQGL